jgi:ubiquinol-cytochrome c reductase iron-sulfur subunit
MRIVQAFSITGLGFLAYPFVKTWLPGSEEDNSLEVDVGDMRPGQIRLIRWRGRRVVIQKRTPGMLDRLNLEQTIALKDPDSTESRQPDFAENEFRSLNPGIFVAYLNCTHLGCEVMTNGDRGFLCPCHSSEYDPAGRVREGAAAPINLEIPFYRFVSRNTLRLEQDAKEQEAG